MELFGINKYKFTEIGEAKFQTMNAMQKSPTTHSPSGESPFNLENLCLYYVRFREPGYLS